ncbi:hypothetical protein SAMN04488018_10712 [Myroides marinus]|uniref:Uncharacterized protein n=1 Tax=Myroides marinus TaxID=703342 RepID=A0A1H6UJ25_9FLAO|nr:hypothetical protein SAMN04488018_10712 [Myroides marinus]
MAFAYTLAKQYIMKTLYPLQSRRNKALVAQQELAKEAIPTNQNLT